jgi:hypothetical protein
MLVPLCAKAATNEKLFMKKGEVGTRPPVIPTASGLGFISMLNYFQLLHSIPSAGANVD